MLKHILTVDHPPQSTPSSTLPDGLITGNGDVTAILAGGTDRVRIYVGKEDFWKADGRVYAEHRGGIAPLGMVEILLPHLAHSDYRAEQDLDHAHISLSLTEKNFDANIKITVCAEENTIIIELDKTHPYVSASLSLISLEGSDAVTKCGELNGVSYTVRGFDTPECRFPSYGICALKQISKTVSNGREHTVWAISVATNHDTAAYMSQAIERVRVLDLAACQKLLASHNAWWKSFWAKSCVELPDKKLELYWYAGIYAIACCARNKKFPPGIWGYSTADSMGWFGDYHLNYNYEAPFYALTSSNHPELLECYSSPLNDFLPIGKQYAKEYLGIDGVYLPVGIGPLGMETDYRPDSKEHSHLFLGQKSNAAYATVIPMMHWYGTRDKDFAKREYYDYLLSVAEFWENYLVFEDGAYQIYNDALNEVAWYAGPDYMPTGHDDKNPAVSKGLVRMLMKLMIDISNELGLNIEKIPKWQHILDHLPHVDVFEDQGEMVLRGTEGNDAILELPLEYVYPIGEIGKYTTPELYVAARNTHKRLAIWDSGNRFCSYYPAAARLGYSPEEIISHIHEVIEMRGLPNGMFRYGGGGLENSAAVPGTVNEMLLQSYEGIIRLFPAWDKKQNARFRGLRAKGGFLIDASLENGEIKAEIISEQGMPLVIEAPNSESILVMGDGQKIPMTKQLVTVNTKKGERILLQAPSESKA